MAVPRLLNAALLKALLLLHAAAGFTVVQLFLHLLQSLLGGADLLTASSRLQTPLPPLQTALQPLQLLAGPLLHRMGLERTGAPRQEGPSVIGRWARSLQESGQ